jgi:hypothetical protein
MKLRLKMLIFSSIKLHLEANLSHQMPYEASIFKFLYSSELSIMQEATNMPI